MESSQSSFGQDDVDEFPFDCFVKCAPAAVVDDDPLARPQTPQESINQTKKMKWTPEEDQLLLESVKEHGTGNWPLIASAITGRTGKQCRERWLNQLKPDLNLEDWSTQEDHILIQQQRIFGNSWSKVALSLPGRSANAIKNRWSWLNRHKNRNQKNLAQFPQPQGNFSPQFCYPGMMVAAPSFVQQNAWMQRMMDPRALSDPRCLSDPNAIGSFSQSGTPGSEFSFPLVPQTPEDKPFVQPTTTNKQSAQSEIQDMFQTDFNVDDETIPFW